MRWRTLAVVALLVCAGCSSLVDGGEEPADPATMTPAPVPATTPTPERWPVTPGLSARGVVDVDALSEVRELVRERVPMVLHRDAGEFPSSRSVSIQIRVGGEPREPG